MSPDERRPTRFTTRLDGAACESCLRYARKLTVANGIALGVCIVGAIVLAFGKAIAGPGLLLFAAPAEPLILGIGIVNLMGIIGAINLVLMCRSYRRAAVLLALSVLPGLLFAVRVATIPH